MTADGSTIVPLPVEGLLLLRLLDLSGTVVFAFSGALLAVRKRLDVFGVVVLAAVAALGGGVVRDVLIGTRPLALEDTAYAWTALAAGLVAFFGHRLLERVGPAVRVFDAFGLGLFVVTGTYRAIDAGLSPLPAIALGMMTGIGGGVLRDLLAGEIPLVLRREVYALAAIAGAAVVVAGAAAELPRLPVALASMATTSLLRLLAVAFGWQAPRAPGTVPPTSPR